MSLSHVYTLYNSKCFNWGVGTEECKAEQHNSDCDFYAWDDKALLIRPGDYYELGLLGTRVKNKKKNVSKNLIFWKLQFFQNKIFPSNNSFFLKTVL